jgi:hypothetical protein
MPQNNMDATTQARLMQWQARFENAQRMMQSPRRPEESPEQFQMRQRAAAEQMSQLQMSKPTGYNAIEKGKGGQPAAPPKPQGRGLSGIYDYIASAMGGGQ